MISRRRLLSIIRENVKNGYKKLATAVAETRAEHRSPETFTAAGRITTAAGPSPTGPPKDANYDGVSLRLLKRYRVPIA